MVKKRHKLSTQMALTIEGSKKMRRDTQHTRHVQRRDRCVHLQGLRQRHGTLAENLVACTGGIGRNVMAHKDPHDTPGPMRRHP